MYLLFDQEFNQEHQEKLDLLTAYQKSKDQHSDETLRLFQDIIKHYYMHHKRNFAWRENITPYHVVVSEIMLQQTQTDRVAQKFDTFTKQFPDFLSLAQAPFAEVLRYWKGLGYNRRALFLQKIAQLIESNHAGALPKDPTILEEFPGIGHATARSIIAFAYNIPTTFIETNIRTVFIYFFFRNNLKVHDKEIMTLVEKTVDKIDARQWYYALMDYGVMLKKTVGNLSRLSAHYTKQSTFQGSDRQIRGMILQTLLEQPGIATHHIADTIKKDEARVQKIMNDLCKEGFIKKRNGIVHLA
jgi:A/G-specific adenine glycosylase